MMSFAAGLNIGELTLGVSAMAMAPQQGQSQANAQFQPQPQVFSPSLVFLGFLIHVGLAMLDKFLFIRIRIHLMSLNKLNITSKLKIKKI